MYNQNERKAKEETFSAELNLQTRRQYCAVITLKQNTALSRDIEHGFVMSRFGLVLPAWIPALRQESSGGSENITLHQDES